MGVHRRLGSAEVTSNGRVSSGIVDVVAQQTPLVSFAGHVDQLLLFGTMR